MLRSLVERFGLTTLIPLLEACETLAGSADAPLDVAVFGQFKSGKSSLLNAVLGGDVLPVGVLPVTTVITRVTAGPQPAARITRHDGTTADIELASIADYVSESRNPDNRLGIAVVDVFTPALADLPNLRLVDTPGLGSIFAHNTQSTLDWLPNVAIALVAVSAERPLSDEDRRLIAELRPHTPRIALVLTKVDLLTESQRDEVRAFLSEQLAKDDGADVPILMFSTREQPQQWMTRLKEDLLRPVALNAKRERERTLAHKRNSLATACREYLTIALHAAEQAESDRQRLSAAVLDESVRESVIQDELTLAAERLIGSCRSAFEKTLLLHRNELARRLTNTLITEMPTWRGHLAEQSAQYATWLREHLTITLEPLSQQAAPVAIDLLTQAEQRFRRIVEAFRDRLSHNLSRTLGITLSPVAWEFHRPRPVVPPVAISQTFMTQWELLWWLIPMSVFGSLFRRHCANRVPWEVEKNLNRLSSDWTTTTNLAITDLRNQAATWTHTELITLTRILSHRPDQVTEIRAALAQCSAAIS